MDFINIHKERGNVLFLILIAVALFAALSYVVTSSSRSGSGTTSRENLKMAVSDIMNYVTAVQTGVIRLQSNGCKEDQISFENPVDAPLFTYTNSRSPSNFSCHIFRPEGGGVVHRQPKPEWIVNPDPTLGYYFYTSGDVIRNIGSDCNSTTCADLSINVWGISKDLCAMINETLGHKNITTTIPSGDLYGCPFTGTFDCPPGGVFQNNALSNALLRGKSMVCYNDGSFGYTFNAVLLAR